MPCFVCSKCGCIENTACCHYWSKDMGNPKRDNPPLCSECDPLISKWHGRFPKRLYKKGDDVLNPPKIRI